MATETKTKTIPRGGQIGELPAVARTGYRFNGWFTEQTGGEQISEETTVSEDTTFFAHWSFGEFWSIICENLENFTNQDLTTLTGEIEEGSIVPGFLPAPNSFIPVKYKISADSDEYVTTQFQVLGYNGSIPEYVKYKSEDGKTIFVASKKGDYLSAIAVGDVVYEEFDGGYADLGNTVDAIRDMYFTYGQTCADWGTSATDSGSYDVPMNLTVSSVQYTFAGYNMTIMSRYGLRTSVDGTSYNRIYFSKNGSSPKSRWTTSEIRSWMNSTGSSTGATWYSESGSTTSTSVPGLLDRFEPVMLGSVSKAVNRTFVYNGSVDHAVDTFWLPGRSNINASEYTNVPDCKNDTCKFSTAFEDTKASRIRYYMSDTGASSGTPCYWWLRSAYNSSYYVGYVSDDGSAGLYNGSSYYAVLPVCSIASNPTIKEMWEILNSNLQNFTSQDITSLTGELVKSDIVSGKLPAPGSFIPVKYKIDATSDFVETQFQVLGYNGSIPEYVKYKSDSGDLIYVKSIGEGGFLSSIVDGVSAFSDKNGSDCIGLVTDVSQEMFRYGQTNQDWGISATESGSYDVPMNLTVDNVGYIFCGYNMTIMSRYGLRTSVDGTAYNGIYFSKNGSSPTNRWLSSEIRNWMNNSGTNTGATWYSESGSTTLSSVPGLLDRFDSEMLGAVSKAVNRTYVYNSSVLDHAVDKFWLLGNGNVNYNSLTLKDYAYDTSIFSGVFDENTQTSTKRIRYYMGDTGGSPGAVCHWRLRSAHSDNDGRVGGVGYGGYVVDGNASGASAVLPICLID